MADDADRADDTDGVSPWLRDDWTADPASIDPGDSVDGHIPSAGDRWQRGVGVGSVDLPDAGGIAPHHPDQRTIAPPARRRTVRAVLATAVVGLLAGVGIWVVSDDPAPSADGNAGSTNTAADAERAPIDAQPHTVGIAANEALGDTGLSDAPGVNDASDVSDTADSDTAGVGGTTRLGDTADVSDSANVGGASSRRGRLIGDGDDVEWIESNIEVGPRLASLVEATEVIVATHDRMIHRIEFPAGRVRSFDMTTLASDMTMVGEVPLVTIGSESLVIARGSDVAVLRDDSPVAATAVLGGAHMVQPRAGTDDFVITGSSSSDGSIERRWILHHDATLDDAPESIANTAFWESTFLPSGALVLNRAGGAYAIADDGTATRISSGVMIATGTNHYLLEECDEALQCRFVTVDGSTGESTSWDVQLPDVQMGGSAGTGLSPDGQALLYFDFSDGHGRQRMLDLTTGASFDVGSIDQLVWQEAWARDSSGVFVEEDGHLRFIDRSDGSVAVFNLARVASVATRRPAKALDPTD